MGCIVGGGFSGSPVISINDGSVVGMVDYLPTEIDNINLKIGVPASIEGDLLLQYPAGISLAIPLTHIKSVLDLALKYEINH